MSITPIQTTPADQVQAPQKVGGGGGHRGKAPQTNQMAHAANVKGPVADFKSQIASQLKKTEDATVSGESSRREHGSGNDQPKKPRPKPETSQADTSGDASGLINVMV